MLRGTRVIEGAEARIFSEVIRRLSNTACGHGFQEIILPSIWEPQTFDKVGTGNQKMMFLFKDKGNRDVCLVPEGTGIIQELSREKKINPYAKKLFYVQRCYRYERPQRGRYREFTQFGVEILGGSDRDELYELFALFIDAVVDAKISFDVKRGLDYYIGTGIEAKVSNLGAQSQIAGGGVYKEGMGFAIGIDRVTLSIMSTRKD